MRQRLFDKATLLAFLALLVAQFTTLAIFCFPYTQRISWLKDFLDRCYGVGSTMLGILFLLAFLCMVVTTGFFLWFIFKKEDETKHDDGKPEE